MIMGQRSSEVLERLGQTLLYQSAFMSPLTTISTDLDCYPQKCNKS